MSDHNHEIEWHVVGKGETKLRDLTVLEAEALFAMPLNEDPNDLRDDFCEPELIEVYRILWRREHCDICGRRNENNPSDHYHYCECKRKVAQAELDRALASGADSGELHRLKEAVLQAGYTGD